MQNDAILLATQHMRRAGIVPAPFTHPAAYVVDTRYILQRAALLLEPDGQPFYNIWTSNAMYSEPKIVE